MAGLNDVKNSPYLAKEDFPKPMVVTIKGHRKENVAREGDPAEMKVIMYFQGLTKGLRLNVTNSRAVFQVCGLPEYSDFDECNGKQITIYNDVNVMMGNERKGGIRVYVPPVEIPGLPGGNPNHQAKIGAAMAQYNAGRPVVNQEPSEQFDPDYSMAPNNGGREATEGFPEDVPGDPNF